MTETRVGGTGSGAPEGMHGAAKRLGDDVERRADQAAGEGKAKLAEQLDRGTSRIGSETRSLATTLRRSGEQLADERGDNEAAQLTRSLATQLEQAGAYLERTRGGELLEDAERFARRRPWLVAGSAALAGLVASRLLKASSDRRYVRSSRGPTWERPQTDRAELGLPEREPAWTSGG